MKILIILLISSGVFSQIGRLNRFFFAKNKDLFFFDGEKINAITNGFDQLCFPYFLKNSDLYEIRVNPVSFNLIARGVTKVFNNHYLVRNKLYTIVNGSGVYITDNVTDVFDSCPDPHFPFWRR